MSHYMALLLLFLFFFILLLLVLFFFLLFWLLLVVVVAVYGSLIAGKELYCLPPRIRLGGKAGKLSVVANVLFDFA